MHFESVNWASPLERQELAAQILRFEKLNRAFRTICWYGQICSDIIPAIERNDIRRVMILEWYWSDIRRTAIGVFLWFSYCGGPQVLANSHRSGWKLSESVYKRAASVKKLISFERAISSGETISATTLFKLIDKLTISDRTDLLIWLFGLFGLFWLQSKWTRELAKFQSSFLF